MFMRESIKELRADICMASIYNTGRHVSTNPVNAAVRCQVFLSKLVLAVQYISRLNMTTGRSDCPRLSPTVHVFNALPG